MAKREPILVEFSNEKWAGAAVNEDLFPMVQKRVPGKPSPYGDGCLPATTEDKRIFVQRRKVTLTSKASGDTFWFTGQKRGGVMTFSDSRDADPKTSANILRQRHTPDELKAMLTRWIGDADASAAVWAVTCR